MGGGPTFYGLQPSVNMSYTSAQYFGVSTHSQRPSPAGWEYYIQAEGQLYFASSHMTIRFVTEEYLFTDGIRDEVEEFIRILQSALLSVGEEGWTDTEVFVETSEEEWQYYIVSHPNRCVMWLDQQDISWLSDEICGVECLAHFSALMQSFDSWIY